MEDAQIIELFFVRSEDAISELDKKYGKLCHKASSATSSRTTSLQARRMRRSA